MLRSYYAGALTRQSSTCIRAAPTAVPRPSIHICRAGELNSIISTAKAAASDGFLQALFLSLVSLRLSLAGQGSLISSTPSSKVSRRPVSAKRASLKPPVKDRRLRGTIIKVQSDQNNDLDLLDLVMRFGQSFDHDQHQISSSSSSNSCQDSPVDYCSGSDYSGGGDGDCSGGDYSSGCD